jgi:Fe-S cluster biogenesis protein NfuA
MSAGIKQSIRYFSRIVEPDGGRVALVNVEGDRLIVSYDPGSSDCDDCSLPPETLAEMMQEDLEKRGLGISQVIVESPEE